MMISRISSMVTANSKVKDSISQDDYKTCCHKVETHKPDAEKYMKNKLMNLYNS